jgi:hypothetical protein
MKPLFKWLESLGFSESEVMEWYNSMGPRSCFAKWLILNKKVDENDYLGWAFNTYKIPVIKSDFFATQKPDFDLLKRYSNIFPDGVYPIQEWDGILYLACLEPKTDFTPPQTCQWLLAPISQLFPWLKIESPVTMESPEPVGSEMPMGLNIQLDPASPKSTSEFDFSNLAPEGSTPTTEQKSDFEMPAGFNSENIEIGSDFQTPDLAKSDFGSADLQSQNEFLNSHSEMPGGLDLSSLSFNSGAENTVSLTPDQHKGDSIGHTEIAADESIMELAPIELTPLENSFEEGPKTKTIELGASNLVPAGVELPPPPDTAVTSIRPNVVPVARASTPPPRKGLTEDDADTVREVTALIEAQSHDIASEIFAKLPKAFSKSMIFTIQDKELEPIQWTPNWKQDRSRSPNVDLSTPSIFRIVKESSAPFHGPIVRNSINDAFFATWNEGVIPEFVTVVPIRVKNITLGMILGCTTFVESVHLNLDRIQEIGTEIGNALIEMQNSAA